jgi:hypothetical protein
MARSRSATENPHNHLRLDAMAKSSSRTRLAGGIA